MAKIVRYFSTTSAGAADGTTWADRATFLSSGTVSTIITGFAFNGTDSFEPRLGPGTYPLTVNWSAANWTNPPTLANQFTLHGCDSSGNLLTPPNPAWISAQGTWDDSGLPVIATTTAVGIGLANSFCHARLIKFTATNRTAASVVTMNGTLDWCSVVNSTNQSATSGLSATGIYNCMVSMTGAAYGLAVTGAGVGEMRNCRLTGITGSSGTRYGVQAPNAYSMQFNTFIGFGGAAIFNGGGTSGSNFVSRNTMVNCAYGYQSAPNASQTVYSRIAQNYISGMSAYAVSKNTNGYFVMFGNRMRDNSSGNVDGPTLYPEYDSYTTSGSDATEFVNSGSGDYRIKNGSAVWGKGYGAGDEAQSSGSGMILPCDFDGGMG